jgi:hypothetical protein
MPSFWTTLSTSSINPIERRNQHPGFCEDEVLEDDDEEDDREKEVAEIWSRCVVCVPIIGENDFRGCNPP